MTVEQELEGGRACRLELKLHRWGPPNRANRGGAWFHGASSARDADTHMSSMMLPHHFKGIRLVKDDR